MRTEELLQFACRYVEENPANHVSPDLALDPSLAGMRMFDAPILGVAAADDPYFAHCKQAEVIGPHHLSPREWLPEAESVIALFFPITKQVRQANALDMSWPAAEWLHARIEGQTFIEQFISDLHSKLSTAGYATLVPMFDARFAVVEKFSSTWSERHTAYACGLGTFGLSKGMITEKGIAGRFCSLVTSLVLEPTERPYERYDAYCNRCGACARNCPAQAITLEQGKDHPICDDFMGPIRLKEAPRYGCGKCQVKVPCEDRIPHAI